MSHSSSEAEPDEAQEAEGNSSAEIPEAVFAMTGRIEPRSAEWRLQVAALAAKFFSLQHSATAAKWIGKTVRPNTVDPWAVIDFLNYLTKVGIRSAGDGSDVSRLLIAMERAGLLVPAGWHPKFTLLGQQYIAAHSPTAQKNGEGVLWLAETLGAELIIPTIQRATALIFGSDGNGDPVGGVGSGLILDRTHLVTNKHVVEGILESGGHIGIEAPGILGEETGAKLGLLIHPHLDVAVIELRTAAFTAVDGLVFRDPDWSDEVYVFGYPPVPMTSEVAMTVQRGEVVNPSTESPATGGAPRHKIFLYSAIARPGNSGGPIVAHDGRVIGLVVEHSASSASGAAKGFQQERIERIERDVEDLKTKIDAPPFYRGIPSSEIMRALTDFGKRGSAFFEGVDPPHDVGEIATVHFPI